MRLLYYLLFLPYSILAQTLDRTEQQAAYRLQIARVQDAIQVDGELSETTW